MASKNELVVFLWCNKVDLKAIIDKHNFSQPFLILIA